MRLHYLRPLSLAILQAVAGTLGIWMVWSFILFPEGDPLAKLIWLLTCGLVMGCTIGSLTNLLTVGRFAPSSAGLFSCLLAVAVFVTCDVLCFQLDHHYHYWGTDQRPAVFFVSGIVLSVVAAGTYSMLVFTDRGRRILGSLGL